jgi:hypothetical protein
MEDYITKVTDYKLMVNNVEISAWPSHNCSSMRSLPVVRFCLIDEGDFFPPGQQQEIMDVTTRYIGKSDIHIALISTPNAAGLLLEREENRIVSHTITYVFSKR